MPRLILDRDVRLSPTHAPARVRGNRSLRRTKRRCFRPRMWAAAADGATMAERDIAAVVGGVVALVGGDGRVRMRHLSVGAAIFPFGFTTHATRPTSFTVSSLSSWKPSLHSSIYLCISLPARLGIPR